MKTNLLSAFQNKQFVFLWLAEVFTQVPVNLLNFLLILIIFDLTKSNTAVSAIILSFTLPSVFLGILAGVYIDRWNKKKVLLTTNILRAIFFVILALFPENIYIIFSLSLLISIITQFFIPAETPIIPLIVSGRQLLSANALFGIGFFGSILVAYLLAGPLLLYVGIVKTLFLLSGMLIIAAILLSAIKVPGVEEKKKFNFNLFIPFPIIKKEVRDLIQVITSSRHIYSSLLLLALSQILILMLAAIAPGYANEVLHISVQQFPLVVITPATFGIILGALLIANVLHNKEKEHIVTGGIFISGLVMMILPYGSRIASKHFVHGINTYLPRAMSITNIDIIVFLAFILGIANALVFIPSNTFLQEKTGEAIRGKIYGSLSTVVGIFSFMPILLVGSFSDLIGVSKVLLGIGICLLGLGTIRIFLR